MGARSDPTRLSRPADTRFRTVAVAELAEQCNARWGLETTHCFPASSDESKLRPSSGLWDAKKPEILFSPWRSALDLHSPGKALAVVRSTMSFVTQAGRSRPDLANFSWQQRPLCLWLSRVPITVPYSSVCPHVHKESLELAYRYQHLRIRPYWKLIRRRHSTNNIRSLSRSPTVP